MSRKLCVLLVVSIILTGCAVGNKSYGLGKEPGIGRGKISNVDPLNNGMVQYWIQMDNTFVYCSMDKALLAKVKSILKEENDEVIYTYRDWMDTDPEWTQRDSDGRSYYMTCGQFYTDTHSSKLLSVDLVKREPTPTP